MATLTNTKIKDTYVGLLKTTDNQAIDAAGVTLVEDGSGNASALSVGRSGNGVTITGNLAVDTNTLYVDAANNRVGVGRSNPASYTSDDSSLYVKGQIRVDGVTNTAAVPSLTLNDTNSGLFAPAANEIAISTAATERMRIDSSGNVGIGTSSPASLNAFATNLTIAGSSASIVLDDTDASAFEIASLTDSLRIYNETSELWRIDSSGNVGIGVTSARSILETDGTISINDSRSSVTTGDTLTGIEIYTNDVSYNPPSGRANMPINRILPVVEVSGGDAFGMAFYTADQDADSVERMRITSGGEVYIAGTTDQGAYNLQCNGTGVWGQGAYVNGSDIRFKEEIKPIESGLDVVKKLKPVSYKYKKEFSRDTTTQAGFIAQDLQEALEGKEYLDGIVKSDSEYLSVAYQSLIPILTKAIQELKAEIESLKSQING